MDKASEVELGVGSWAAFVTMMAVLNLIQEYICKGCSC